MSARHTLDLLGETLRALAPLVAAAVQALDKPGTRALRRKLDGEFHYVLGQYGTLRRMETPESRWDVLHLTLPRYERATEVWPGRVAFEARKARDAETSAPVRAPERGHALRLVVDNVSVSRIVPQIFGGAA